jgi:hypothetical protein
MRTITVCFSKAKNHPFPIGSLAIRLYLGTDYSHVSYHFLDEVTEEPVVYEAVGAGLRFIGKRLWEDHAEIVDSYKLEVSEETYTEMHRVCILSCGKPYGYMQNLGIYLADILNCTTEIEPVFNRDGYYYDKTSDKCWFECAGKGFLGDKIMFKFRLELEHSNDLRPEQIMGLKTITKTNLATLTQRHKCYYYQCAQDLRRIRRRM